MGELNLIGVGVYDKWDISMRGLKKARECDVIYLESYTHKLGNTADDFHTILKKKVIPLMRRDVENDSDKIIERAKTEKVGLLIGGTVFAATTHISLFLEAKKAGVKVNVIEGSSVFTSIGIVGLELYKYGKTTSIPFQEVYFEPDTPYFAIQDNQKHDLHTLILLDLKPEEGKFMRVNEAIKYLLYLEEKLKKGVITDFTFAIGCARVGSPNPFIRSGKIKDLIDVDFGEAPHCLIIPARMHFMEKDAYDFWKKPQDAPKEVKINVR